MKRIYVYPDKTGQNGKVVAVEDSIVALKMEISKLFEVAEEVIHLFTVNGCEIHDIRVLRDEESIYLNLHEENLDNIEKDMINLSLEQKAKSMTEWITLNVGGKHFTTSRSTLTVKEPLSMLARMFATENNVYLMNPSATDSSGAYLIDRSPKYFEPILNYLRHGVVIIDKNENPKGVLEEATFYGLYN